MWTAITYDDQAPLWMEPEQVGNGGHCVFRASNDHRLRTHGVRHEPTLPPPPTTPKAQVNALWITPEPANADDKAGRCGTPKAATVPKPAKPAGRGRYVFRRFRAARTMAGSVVDQKGGREAFRKVP